MRDDDKKPDREDPRPIPPAQPKPVPTPRPKPQGDIDQPGKQPPPVKP